MVYWNWAGHGTELNKVGWFLVATQIGDVDPYPRLHRALGAVGQNEEILSNEQPENASWPVIGV